ncbi:MAG TPA: HIT family protein [Gammaproteobacteria bacterium]|nr:HIT family protein [Gammaproteobacteria bacterium]|tara:strand:+ start:1773 stop:2213 length:441 start_codon:yes stop_codon:yes gene_type:complete
MAYDADNIFAKILRGDAPAFKVYEDDHTLAFMDVMPQAPGHTLVIPKDPAENLHDANPEILGHTIQVVQKVAAAVKQAQNVPGVMIAQLNGAAAGQTVFHLHFHIIPRTGGVDMSMHAREMADFGELEQQAVAIRAALAGAAGNHA